MRKFQSRVVDATNALISAAQVTVYKVGTTTLASLFSGEGSVALANPFKSDHLGVFEFYVENGDYDIDVQDPVTGFARRFADITIFDANVMASGDMAGNARVGVRVQSGGSTIKRRRINLISGGNISLSIADDSVNEEVDVTIDSIGGGAPTGSPYVVMALDGTLTAERRLFSGDNIKITDAGANADVTLEALVAVRKQSAAAAFRRKHLNLISGSNISLTVTDDPGNDEVDVTIDSVGGGAPTGSQYVVMALDGTLTAERRLFSGDNIRLTDGGANADAVLESLVAVRKQSATAAFRRKHLNLISGSGVAITVADDSPNDEVDATFALANPVDVADLAVLKSGASMQGRLLLASGDAALPGLGFVDDPDTGWFRPSIDAMGVATGGVERIRLASGGNIGIGTASPAAQVHIRRDATGITAIVENALAGTTTAAGLSLKNDTGNTTDFILASSIRTAYGILTSNSAGFYTTLAAGLMFMADVVGGRIRFAAGGPSEVVGFDVGGFYLVEGKSVRWGAGARPLIKNSGGTLILDAASDGDIVLQSEGTEIARFKGQRSQFKQAMARVRMSANQLISDNLAQFVAWDTEEFDTDGLHVTTTPFNSRLTAPVTGKYEATANIWWTANAAGYRELFLMVNRTTTYGAVRIIGIGSVNHPMSLTTLMSLAAGDYVEAQVLQSTGAGGLNILNVPSNALMMHYIGE
jgi:hypothetical protein